MCMQFARGVYSFYLDWIYNFTWKKLNLQLFVLCVLYFHILQTICLRFSLPSQPCFFLPFLIITSREEACNEGRSWSGLSTTQLSPLMVNSVPLQATNSASRVGTCLRIVEPFKHLFCATVHLEFWCLSCEHPWALARDNMVFPLWVCMGWVHHAINEYQLGLDVQHFFWPVNWLSYITRVLYFASWGCNWRFIFYIQALVFIQKLFCFLFLRLTRNETLVYQQLSLHQLHHPHPSQRLTKRFFLLRDITRSIYVRIKSLLRVLSALLRFGLIIRA